MKMRARIKFFVYDVVNHNKLWKQGDWIRPDTGHEIYAGQQYALFSGVRSGQTDIYVYKIDKQTFEQVTNDVYDDLDPSFCCLSE